jgi:hypothetical protein
MLHGQEIRILNYAPGFPFKVSARWVQDFKKEHQIRQRHVTKYISNRENMTFEETVKAVSMVFICLQERSSTFGPRICKGMRTLSQKFGNFL